MFWFWIFWFPWSQIVAIINFISLGHPQKKIDFHYITHHLKCIENIKSWENKCIAYDVRTLLPRDVCRLAGGPLALTSANYSAESSTLEVSLLFFFCLFFLFVCYAGFNQVRQRYWKLENESIPSELVGGGVILDFLKVLWSWR